MLQHRQVEGYTLLELIWASSIAALLIAMVLAALTYAGQVFVRYQQSTQLLHEAAYVSAWMRTQALKGDCAYVSPLKMDIATGGTRLPGMVARPQAGTESILVRGHDHLGKSCLHRFWYVAKSSSGDSSLYVKNGSQRSVALSSLVSSMHVRTLRLSGGHQLLRFDLLFSERLSRQPWAHRFYDHGHTIEVFDRRIYLPWSIWLGAV